MHDCLPKENTDQLAPLLEGSLSSLGLEGRAPAGQTIDDGGGGHGCDLRFEIGNLGPESSIRSLEAERIPTPRSALQTSFAISGLTVAVEIG